MAIVSEREDAYWAAWPAGRVLVAVATALVCDKLMVRASAIDAAAQREGLEALGEKLIARQRALGDDLLRQGFNRVGDESRFLRFARQMNPNRKFGHLAAALVGIADQADADTKGPLLSAVVEKLRPGVPAGAAASPNEERRSVPGPPGTHRETLEGVDDLNRLIIGLAAAIDIGPADVESAHEAFAGRSRPAPSELYYLCYRFHSTPRKVVKSFMAIKPATDLVHATFFTNVAVDAGAHAKRISRGLVLPAGERLLYFLGSVVDNNALKIIVLERPRSPRDSYVGLIVCIDDDGSVVAGRVLMKKTAFTNDVEAGIGPPIDVEEARHELGDEDLDKIRNRISFKVEDGQPVFYDGQKLSTPQLVTRVREVLQTDGKPLFTYGTPDGDEFNPADELFYTFNAALTIWRSGEKPTH
jgi:hypothetical protein